MAKKKLRCRVQNPEENRIPDFAGHEGQECVVVGIDESCSPAPPYCYWVRVKFEGDEKAYYGPSTSLVPLDTSMVPDTHDGTTMLRHVWIFGEARRDFWFKKPPTDPEDYIKEWGEPWVDERTFDIEGMK